MKQFPDATNRRSGGANTLAGEYYKSEEVFAREIDRIFACHWLCVGRADEFAAPGDSRVAGVAGDSVILVRDDAGGLHGFYNVCRHRGTRLLEEGCHSLGKTIRCPYHGWSYDRTGCLVAAPHMSDVEGFHLGDYPLHAVAVAEWEGFVFVNLAEDPVPISDAFAPVWDRFRPWSVGDLVSVAPHTYEIAANWKLLFENYNECYHCSLIHPQLAVLSPSGSASNDVEAGAFLGGPMELADGIQSMTVGGGLCGELFPDLDSADSRRVYYYSLFPTLLLSPHPDFVLVHRIEPVDAASTRVVCEFLFPPPVAQRADFDARPVVDFWDETNRQDWEICERSQLGVTSRGYRPGPYSNRECTVAAFDRHYLSVMERD